MNQRKLDPKEEEEKKKSGWYESELAKTYDTFAGFTFDFQNKKTFDDTPEEREKFFHWAMVEKGGFRFWLNTYMDMLFDQKANDEAYNFWKKTVRKRIPDPKKQELLAPENPPHVSLIRPQLILNTGKTDMFSHGGLNVQVSSRISTRSFHCHTWTLST